MPRKIRQIRIEGNIAYVPLTKGYEAIVDKDDLPLVESFCWWVEIAKKANGSIRAVYAVRSVMKERKSRLAYMHRVIAQTPIGMETDHIDGDGLNNRRENLRVVTTAQNQHNQRTPSHNTSGVKGVCWDKGRCKWRAYIKLNGRLIHLGMFEDILDAAAAYAKASENIHGDFGRLK